VKIEYTGRQIDIDDDFRVHAERKLRKLGKVLHDITHVHVVVTADRHRKSVELTVQSRHLTLAASEESNDLVSSLSMVIDKLVRQAQRHLGKLRTRKHYEKAGRGLWSGILAPATSATGEKQRLIHSRRFVAKPMTVDEAVLELSKSSDELVVFRDASTERISVLFRRKDGHLGIIEPEA
jgi:putative sigma-54 modulation protein